MSKKGDTSPTWVDARASESFVHVCFIRRTMKWLYNDHMLNIGSPNSVQVKTKLKGHHRRITGLAFSNTLNVLVSSGADAQVISILDHG